MAHNPMQMDRRSILKTAGIGAATAAAGGAGALFLIGSGAAASVNISAADVHISTDHGEIDRVSAQPRIDIVYNGFDEVVGKIRILIEASPHDVDSEHVGDYAPVWRATAWLNGTNEPDLEVETGPGYHGELHVANEWFGGDGITLYDREGPDYGELTDAESFFDGTSVGQDIPDGGYENGIYEQAGTVDRFFNPTDGTVDASAVNLRYTISLHLGNESSTEGFDVPEEFVQPHSPLVMADAPDVDDPITDYPPEAIPYGVLRDHAAGHPAIVVDEPTFNVNVENEPSEQNGGGESNTDGSGSDDVEEDPE